MSDYTQYEIGILNNVLYYLKEEGYEDSLPSFYGYKEEAFTILKVAPYGFITFFGERGTIHNLQVFTHIEDAVNYIINDGLCIENGKNYGRSKKLHP